MMSLPIPSAVTVSTGRAVYLHHAQAGTRPVLLLHGGGLDRASLSWRHLFPLLARDRTVIAPNWPGYGGSNAFGRPYTVPDLGRWLIALMDVLEIDQADLVGISMGGGTALWTALHHPERVRRLVPVGTYGVQRHVSYHWLSYLAARLPLNAIGYALMRSSRWLTRQALAAIFADRRRVTAEMLDEVRQLLADRGLAQVFAHFQRGEIGFNRLRSYLTPELNQIKHPTLFIHGQADPLVPLSAVEKAAARMPEAQLQLLDAGHWPMWEQVAAFNGAVQRFLS